jgi:O-antigen ligase
MQLSTLSRPHFLPRPVAERHIKTLPTVNDVHLFKRPVRWAFYAFVFSLIFEEIPIPIPVEVTLITTGLLLLAALLLQPHRCYRRPPTAFWCFIIYLWLGIVILGFYYALFDSAVIFRQFKLLQLIVIFWIAYNLMRDENTATGALLSLVASCAVMSVLNGLGLTVTTEASMSKLGRLTAFGLDANQLGGMLALGIVTLVGLVGSFKRDWIRPRFLTWPVAALLAITLVQTGSRGALLALGAGLAVLTLRKGTVLSRLRNVLVVLLGIGFLSLIAYQSEMVKHRFTVTLEEGNMSEREEIYPAAWQMFVEKPVIGWGPVTNTMELGTRLGLYGHEERIDAHNLILYVLTAAGIVGAIPFFAGVWLCVRAAWLARGGAHGILPLAMTVTILTADMSVSGLNWKQHWLVLAYALASGSQFVTKPQRTHLNRNLVALRPTEAATL